MNITKKPEDLIFRFFCYADKGNRTLTMLPSADFESAASASSATSACDFIIVTYLFKVSKGYCIIFMDETIILMLIQ